jgi:hypothetical protein
MASHHGIVVVQCRHDRDQAPPAFLIVHGDEEPALGQSL